MSTPRRFSVGVVALTLLLAGCIAVPVDLPDEGSRRNINVRSADEFVVGVSTKQDVLLRLGEPDVVSADEHSLGYAWSRIKFFWVVGTYGGGAAGKISKQAFLRLSFDEADRFTGADITSHWTPFPESSTQFQPEG